MSSSHEQPENIDKRKNFRPDDSFYGQPDVILLDERDWSYIQRRYYMTSREIQVAKLVCQGFSNEEIANHLKIKHGTVKTHLRNIYRRIRVKNKIAMLLKFIQDTIDFFAKPQTASSISIASIEQTDKNISTHFDMH